MDRQESDCRDLAEQLGYTVVKVIVDNDTSAYKGKRRGYEELLKDLRGGVGDAVIAWHSDRLHRQPKELEAFIEIIEQRAAIVHFVRSGPVDLATPSGRMHARIAGAVDRHESEHKAERISAQRKQHASMGRWNGGPRPFGYMADGVTLNPIEAAVIRRAFDMLLLGGSIRSVIRMLNDAGTRTTRTQSLWQHTTARAMILRERNAGISVHVKDREAGTGLWPAIVTVDEFNTVRDMLKDPKRAVAPGAAPRWLGSLLYRCGVCDDTLTVGTTGSPPYPTYRCRSVSRGGAHHVSRGAKNLDPWVEYRLLRRLELPEYAERFVVAEPTVDVSRLRRRHMELEAQRSSQYGRWKKNLITDAEYDNFLLDNNVDVQQVELEIASATVKSPVGELLRSGDPVGAWLGYDLDQKRAVLREVMIVTVLRTNRRGGRFDPAYIDIEWL